MDTPSKDGVSILYIIIRIMNLQQVLTKSVNGGGIDVCGYTV